MPSLPRAGHLYGFEQLFQSIPKEEAKLPSHQQMSPVRSKVSFSGRVCKAVSVFVLQFWNLLPFNLKPLSAPSFSSTLIHGPLERYLPFEAINTIELKKPMTFLNKWKVIKHPLHACLKHWWQSSVWVHEQPFMFLLFLSDLQWLSHVFAFPVMLSQFAF